ncbi:MAG: curli production assembly/transport component CsgF [Bacteroidota bacterium]
MKYLIQTISAILFLISVILLTPGQASGQDFVYQPINPAFGGNPMNYQWLMSSANTQNVFKKESKYGYSRDPFADFEESLQRQVLSELTRNLVRDRFGENFDLSSDSRFEFGEFTIDITPGMDGVTVSIFNVLTGETTNITIPNIDG